MWNESKKQKLIHLAGQLQHIVDELLDCAKEKKEEEKEANEDDGVKVKSAVLAKKLSDY